MRMGVREVECGVVWVDKKGDIVDWRWRIEGIEWEDVL